MISYKEEHQRFMSGHTGTTFSELVLMFSTVCMFTALRDALLLWTRRHLRHTNDKNDNDNVWLRFIFDFGTFVVPSLLIMTLLSDSIAFLFVCLTFLTFALFCVYVFKHRAISAAIILQYVNLDRQMTFVTNFRSIVNLITALAILAVDFRVFPRRLAKTEIFGYGMMDFGVSFFVLSNAIVSPEARGKHMYLPKLIRIKSAVVSSLPLFLIGFLRLISVKGTDYQEHVTEYGVHWNFFFTLAVLKVLSTSLFCLVPDIQPGITGVLIMFGHQYCMSSGLSNYIIQGSDGKGGRTSLLDSNREGIFSLAGYISLYMMGVQLGRFLFIHRANLWEWLRAVVYLLVVVILMVFLNTTLHFNVQMASRRFVNAAYVLSSMIFVYIALIVCLVGDIAKTYCTSIIKTSAFHKRKASSKPSRQTKKGKSQSVENSSNNNESESESKKSMNMKKRRNADVKESCLLQAISFNSLLFFLAANLMTGFVNMSMATIHATTLTSMTVLVAYSFVLSLLIFVLYLKNIKTKFW